MAILLLVSAFALCGAGSAWAAIDITNSFTDTNFRAEVYAVVGKVAPAQIFDTDVSGIASLNVFSRSITSLAGIGHFTALKTLECSENLLTTLPALPSGLETLECSNNQLTALPALPSGLETLNCRYNQLTTLPALPTGLETLDCCANSLASLPILPSGLKKLNFSANKLTTLPTLPSGLESLYCGSTLLSSLPALPSGLKEFSCSMSQLTTLPALPPDLETLFCYNNQLTTLPTLPSGLKTLFCYNNLLTTLPALPSSLTTLYCYNNLLTTLPTLPSSLTTLLCYNNLLKELDVTGLTLTYFNCRYNNMANESSVKGFLGAWGVDFYFSPQRAPGFISAATVIDLPFAVGAGVPLTLSGTVLPADATKRDIEWKINIAGCTGAALAGNVFTAPETGVAIVYAIVEEGVTVGVDLECNFLIHVTAAPIVTTAALPDGKVDEVYSKNLTAAGETPITWTVESGTLPSGLSLSNGGAITGTPEAAGKFSFTVKAENTKGSYTKALSITIKAASGGGGSGGGGGGGCNVFGIALGFLTLAIPIVLKKRRI